MQHLAYVAIGLQIRLGHAIDQGLRRTVGDEMTRQFERKVMGRIRISSQQIEHFFRVAHAAGVIFLAENYFILVVVYLLVEEIIGVALRRANGPSGEGSRDIDYVLLRIAAVYAERVQFHRGSRP